MSTAKPVTADLRRLVEFGVDLGVEPTVEAVMSRVAQEAAAVTDARYAAVGLVDSSGRSLEHFITHGIDDEARAQLGDPPVGRGVLGALITANVPLRLRDLTEDPRSVGFPPGHPPMRSFLGVPLLLRGATFGSLYLTEKKDGGEFTDADEEIASLLAMQAVAAVEHLRVQEGRSRRVRVLESLVEIGNALAAELDLETILDLSCALVRDLAHAELVLVALPDPDGMLRHRAGVGELAAEVIGYRFDPETSKSGRVMTRSRAERVDSMLDDPEVDHRAARRANIRAAMFAPLQLDDATLGVLIVINKVGPDPRFSDDDIRIAEMFASRLATAIDISRRAENDSLKRALHAQETERGRLARELHDETGQALTSIMLGLGAIDDASTQDECVVASAHVREITQGAMNQLRRLATALRPPVLDDFGLAAALERLTESVVSADHSLEVELLCDLDRRLPHDIETALYRMVQESLTNIVKHADATHASIVVQATDSKLVAIVEDNGQGFVPSEAAADSFGLIAMRERLALVGGALVIESVPQSGTLLRAHVPLPERS